MWEDKSANLVLAGGGIGDLLGELVAVNWLVKNRTDMVFYVWAPLYLIEFAKHVLPKKRCIVRSFKEESLFNKKYPLRSTQWRENGITPMRINPVDYGFLCLADRLPMLDERDYLLIRPHEIDINRFNLPKEYICFQGAFAEACKTMPLQTANEILTWLRTRGHQIVLVGREESDCGLHDQKVMAKPLAINLGWTINLLNQTSLLETAAIIARARCFIGMEGGLVHLAGSTDTVVIAAFTLGDPAIHASPVRQGSPLHKIKPIYPDAKIPNHFWQTHVSCFDKRDCRKFPGWENIIASITADKFIEALEDIL